MEEMNRDQKRAFDIWLGSADFDNDFKPMTLAVLVKTLDSEGITTSSSALGRWKKKFDWDDKLKTIVTGSLSEGKAKDIIHSSSLASSSQKILDDFDANEALKSDSYRLLQLQMGFYTEKMLAGKKFTKEEERFLLKVLELTTNREDKLLDRQALLLATKLVSSEDVLEALNDEIIELEIED